MYESEYTFKFNYNESDWLSTFIAANPKEYQRSQSGSNHMLKGPFWPLWDRDHRNMKVGKLNIFYQMSATHECTDIMFMT